MEFTHGNVTLAATRAVEYLTDQLPAGGVDILATGGTHGHIVPTFVEDVLEAANRIVARPLISRMRERIEWDQIDLARDIREQGDHLLGMLG